MITNFTELGESTVELSDCVDKICNLFFYAAGLQHTGKENTSQKLWDQYRKQEHAFKKLHRSIKTYILKIVSRYHLLSSEDQMFLQKISEEVNSITNKYNSYMEYMYDEH